MVSKSAEDILLGGVGLLLSQIQILSLLTSKVRFVRDDTVETLAIKPDLTIIYNEGFVLKNAKYAPGLIFHELLHKIYDSFGRFEMIDHYYSHIPESVRHQIWNIATDCAINEVIKASLIGPNGDSPLPNGHIDVEQIKKIIEKYNPDFLKKTEVKPFREAEYYYHLLMSALNDKMQNIVSAPFGASTLDNHERSAQEHRNARKGMGTGALSDKENKSSQGKSSSEGSSEENIVRKALEKSPGQEQSQSAINESIAEVESDVARSLIEKGINEAIRRNRQAGHGTLGGDIAIDLTSLNKKYPKLYPYLKALLKRMVSEQTLLQNKSRIAPWDAYNVHKSLSQGKPYLPEHPYKRKFNLNITLIVDTSGSMSPADVKEFWQDIYPTLTALQRSGDVKIKIRYMEADAAVVVDETFDFREFTEYVKEKQKYKGGGGTDYYDAVSKAFDVEKRIDRPHVIVYFTDGFCSGVGNVRELMEENPNTQVIFAICSGGTTSYVKELGDLKNVHITTFDKKLEEEESYTPAP